MSNTLPYIQEFMNNSGLAHEILSCDSSMADTRAFCEHYAIPLANSANAMLIRAKKGEAKFTLCIALATHRLDVNHRVRKKLEARKVSFASAEETRKLTKMEIGGVTPVGLPTPIPVWVDDAVMQCDYIILGGGNRSSKIKVSPQIFHLLPNAEIVEGLANRIQDA